MKAVFTWIKDFIKSLDKTLILICLSCSTISMLCLYSFYITEQKNIRVPLVQLISIIMGLSIAIIVSLFDYELLAKLWRIHAPIAILLVVLTYFIGVSASPLADDKAWLDLGVTMFQPSEILKLSFIFTFALHLSKIKGQINELRPFLLLCLHGAVPTALVMFQGDFGSALVFFFIFVVMIFVAGLSLRLISVGIIAALAAAPPIWYFVLPEHLRKRFLVAWHPEIDPIGKGMQQNQGRTAIGSGGLFGRGLKSDNLYHVMESHNDFIFSYIGQTMGFAGTIITLLLITFLCVKILINSKKAKDSLGSYICVGVFAMFLFQAIINIGMVLCALPVVGITLPFFSAGGTSVVVSYVAIGMVLSVHRHGKKDMMFD